MSEAGFIVVYVGRPVAASTYGDPRAIPRYKNLLFMFNKYKFLFIIGERLIVTKVTISNITGTTYYEVSDGRTSGAWYDANLFKRLDDIRAERLDEIGI